MVRLLLDMLMQVAWSWTAFVYSASRQCLIRAASSSAGSMYVSNPVPDGEHENEPVRSIRASVGMLGCRGTERFQHEASSGMAGEAERPAPSFQRKRHATACFPSRNERARSIVTARAAGGDHGAERALVPAGFRRCRNGEVSARRNDQSKGRCHTRPVTTIL